MRNIALMTIFAFTLASGCAAQTRGGATATAKVVGGALLVLSGTGGAIGIAGLSAGITLVVFGTQLLGTGISDLNRPEKPAREMNESPLSEREED